MRSVREIMTLLLAACALAWGPLAVQAADVSSAPVIVETEAGRHEVAVELAVTPEERSRGLMYRTELAPDRGMLFDFGTTAPVVMWMKNTLIPLDMFFLDAEGRIVRIAERTTPLSTARIFSRAPVRFVLEMIGGSAARLGLAPGDVLKHPLFTGVEPGGE